MALLKLGRETELWPGAYEEYPSLKSDGSIEAISLISLSTATVRYPSLKSDGSIEAKNIILSFPFILLCIHRWKAMALLKHGGVAQNDFDFAPYPSLKSDGSIEAKHLRLLSFSSDFLRIHRWKAMALLKLFKRMQLTHLITCIHRWKAMALLKLL